MTLNFTGQSRARKRDAEKVFLYLVRVYYKPYLASYTALNSVSLLGFEVAD